MRQAGGNSGGGWRSHAWLAGLLTFCRSVSPTSKTTSLRLAGLGAGGSAAFLAAGLVAAQEGIEEGETHEDDNGSVPWLSPDKADPRREGVSVLRGHHLPGLAALTGCCFLMTGAAVAFPPLDSAAFIFSR